MKLRRILPAMTVLATLFVFTNAASAGEPFHPIAPIVNFFRSFWF